MCATGHKRSDGVRMRQMIIFSKQASLVAAVVILTFGSHAYATEVRYACGGGTKVTAQFSPSGTAMGRVALSFENGQKVVLPQVMSADGGRYANSDVEFWVKGREASLTHSGNSETCSAR
jgi:membrane-bound inhibitor of C-type lysozyme